MTLKWHSVRAAVKVRYFPGTAWKPVSCCVVSLCDVKTVGASSWWREPAWKMANVFFAPSSQQSVLHRVAVFPQITFSLFSPCLHAYFTTFASANSYWSPTVWGEHYWLSCAWFSHPTSFPPYLLSITKSSRVTGIYSLQGTTLCFIIFCIFFIIRIWIVVQ